MNKGASLSFLKKKKKLFSNLSLMKKKMNNKFNLKNKQLLLKMFFGNLIPNNILTKIKITVLWLMIN